MASLIRRIIQEKHPSEHYVGDIFSPNRKLIVHITLENGEMYYEAKFNGEAVIKKSKLGLKVREQGEAFSGFKLVRRVNHIYNKAWETLWGEERMITNHYHEAIFELVDKFSNRLHVYFRVFDDGVAFRYVLLRNDQLTKVSIVDELSEFQVEPEAFCWHIPAYQPDRYEYNYEKSKVSDLSSAVHTPLTIELSSGQVLSIHEAALYNYGAMTIKRTENSTLVSDITPLSDGARAHVDLPFSSPWRVIMMAESAKDLTINRMVLNLNDPPKGDFSWVRPLKFLGIWWAMYVGELTWAPGEKHGATTANAIEYIDACKKLGIRGLLIEGWNDSWRGDWLENGPTNDFKHFSDDYDFAAVANYAMAKNIKIIGHHETAGHIDNYEEQMEDSYKLCAARGISYVKSGYAGSMMTINGKKEFHHSQAGVLHYQKALELAAKYHIALDVHEPIKGTGIERTWPNLLTREGARGQEYEGGSLAPSHLTILPYTRLLAGGMDYTSGILDVSNETKRIYSTIVRQLALYVVVYSAMQMAADRPRFYLEKYPDLFQFIRDIPLSFEKTVPLFGKIGEYSVTARKDRKTRDWYVGGVTNEEAREVEVPLNFLAKGKYLAEIYQDGRDAHYLENQLAYEIRSEEVSASSVLKIRMAPGGGFAVRLKKI